MDSNSPPIAKEVVEKFFATPRSFANINIKPPMQWQPELFLSHAMLYSIVTSMPTEATLRWFAWANQLAGWMMLLVKYFADSQIDPRVKKMVKPFLLRFMPDSAVENVFFPFFQTAATSGLSSFSQQNWVMILLELFASRPQITIGPMLHRDYTPEQWKERGVLYQFS